MLSLYPGPHNHSPPQPFFLTDVDQWFNIKLLGFAELDKLSRSDRNGRFPSPESAVIQKVAEEIPGLIQRTIFLDALIIEDGHCVFDELPTEYVALFNDLARESSDNTMLIPWEVWRDNFIQDAPEPGARSLWEQLSPEPNQVNLDRLDLKRFYSLAIPRSFIYCRQDKALPPGYFHPRMSSRLGTFKFLEMDGSHEVMFTRSEELADKILEASFD